LSRSLDLVYKTVACMQFRAVQGVFPNHEELTETIEVLEEIAFGVDTSQIEATENLDALLPNIMKENEKDCSLCCEPINIGDSVYTLTPCEHSFHSNASQCLGCETILSWLNKHNTCPVCRKVVIINSIKAD